MSFFLTSRAAVTRDGPLTLKAADAHCAFLAYNVGHGDKNWRAYLDAPEAGGERARDRIGPGPWFNYAGVSIAADLATLHSPEANLSAETVLTEKGERGGAVAALTPETRDDGTFYCFAAGAGSTPRSASRFNDRDAERLFRLFVFRATSGTPLLREA